MVGEVEILCVSRGLFGQRIDIHIEGRKRFDGVPDGIDIAE